MHYFNVGYVRDVVWDRVHSSPTKPKLQSAEVLRGLADELTSAGIQMQVVEARSSVRDRLRAERLDEKIGGVDRFRTIDQVVKEFS